MVNLPAGKHVLRMDATQQYFDIDYISFSAMQDPCEECGLGIADVRLDMPTEVENFRIFDMNGVYLGMVRAVGMQNLRESAAGLVKCGGTYLARSVSGKTLQIRIAK